MTIEQFKMLKLVAELGSLKAASEKLFKTQAAVSKGIKQLESQLDLQLFDRNGYRMEITIEGDRILKLANSLLEKATEIEDLSLHLNAGNEASITLGFNSSFDLSLILPALEDTQAQFPQTQIIIKQEQISGALDALNNEQADLVITVANDAILNQTDITTTFLYEGHIYNVASPKLIKRHPKLKSQKELIDEYQIVVQDSGTQTKGKTFGVQDGQRCWHVSDLSTKKMLTLSGMGWGNLPLFLIADELKSGELIKLELKDAKTEFKLNYHVMKLHNKLLGPVASSLWARLSNL